MTQWLGVNVVTRVGDGWGTRELVARCCLEFQVWNACSR